MTYIVPWKEVVNEDFLPEFIKITRSILAIGVKEYELLQTMYRRLPEEIATEYRITRSHMRFSGYQLILPTDTGRERGWFIPWLKGNEVAFGTNAGSDRVYISPADFLSYRNICALEETCTKDNVDKIFEKLRIHARYMTKKYGVTNKPKE